MIGSSLLRYQDNQKFLLFDLETEGLNLARARPWQIAYAICTINGIESFEVRYPLWEDLSVSDEAARVTRFDKKSYLSKAESAEKVLEDLEQLIFSPNNLLLGHNILGYDIYVLNTWRKLCNRPTDWSYLPKVVDTLCLSRAYRFGIAPDLKNFTAWQYKMLTIRSKAKGMGASLGAMAKEFDIRYNEREAHDAEYDTNINHQVFRKLIWSIQV